MKLRKELLLFTVLAACNGSPATPAQGRDAECIQMAPLTTDQVGGGFDNCIVEIAPNSNQASVSCGWWPVHSNQRIGKLETLGQTVTLEPQDLSQPMHVGRVQLDQTEVEIIKYADGKIEVALDSKLRNPPFGQYGHDKAVKYNACLKSIFGAVEDDR
jgi:hypothetical protein